MEERTRSSIYATAQTVIWPWADPGVAASARPPKGKEGHGTEFAGVDLPWLLSVSNTVYLRTPIEEQRRLAPASGGLLHDLITQAQPPDPKHRNPPEPPL